METKHTTEMVDAMKVLQISLRKEQEEAEAHLYTIIKVARDEDFREQIGRDIYFDLVDHDKVHSFRIRKQMPFNLFKEEVAKELGIPVQFQRFWLWAKRQNNTYRPFRPFTPQEEPQYVGQLRDVSKKAEKAKKANNAELKLFLEVELGQDLRPIPPRVMSKEDILLFFKLYDPLIEELRYVGRLFVKVNGKPMEILTKLNELVGFAPDEEIELFEEIKFEPKVWCEHIDKELTFLGSQLQDGDIICFQKSLQVGRSEQSRYPDVPSFMEYVHNRQAAEHVPSESTLSSKANAASKVRFLSYWVSPEASLVLKRIHCLHKGTFANFSMASRVMQTGVLESFVLFIESMSTTKVNEVNGDADRAIVISIEDFERVGLDLSWLKERIDKAKDVNKIESGLNLARARVRELEEGLAMAKADVEIMSKGLPKSLGVHDSVLKGIL